MRKRLFAVLLCLWLLPAAALAANTTVYGTIEVGGIALTNSESTPTVYATTDAATGAVTAQPTFTETDGWNIKWDGSTLTLRNATIQQAEEYSDKSNEKIAVYLASGNMNLALVGENTVDALGGGRAASCGINLGNGSLSISGEDGASLAVYGGPTERGNSCGIYANGTITIDSGTVTVTGESASADSYGICASGAVTIENGTVNATSGEAQGDSCGIYTYGAVTIEDGSVTATSGQAGGNSCGIYTSNSVTIKDGTVTATGESATGSSYGICAGGAVTINDGTVNATGCNAVRDSCGIYASSFTINGGTVVATGGEAAGSYSMGVRADGGITIHGGVVTATGDTAPDFSWGMCTNYNFTMNGGIVTATSGEAQLTYGIRGGTLTIKSGTLDATSGKTVQDSVGIFAMTDIIISGGTVTAKGGETIGEGWYNFGIRSYGGSVIITDGTVTATGGKANGTGEENHSAGIFVRTGSITVSGGTVTATGGESTGSGINYSAGLYAGVSVTVSGGTATATGGLASTGSTADAGGSYGIIVESTGTTADVTINGNSVVRANMTGEKDVDGEPISDKTTTPENSIVFENGVGTVYGEVILQEDLTVGADESLTIPQDAALTIPNDTTLTNSGTITNKGTLTNNGTLTIGQGGALTGDVIGKPAIYAVTVLTDGNGTASASEIYAAANDTVTLTATPDSGYHFERWEVVSGGVTVENNAFTMPAQPVTVKAIFDRNSSGSSSYTITTPDAEHGTVAVSPSRASSGTTVTITVTPDEGYELGELIVTDANGDEVDLTRESATKYTFEMPRSRVTVAASFVESAPEPLPFDDVDDGDWFADAVRFVYENGMMNGTGDTTFAPDATTSRSMIVTILYRLEGEPVVDDAMDFSDVAGDAWYTDAVRWAAGEGIVGGYGNGLFGSDDAVTREQLAAILYRYAVYKGYDVSIGEDTNLLSYDDFEDLSEYAIPAMQWACGAGIVNGTSESTLTPQGEAERAQVAAMLMRFCEQYMETQD